MPRALLTTPRSTPRARAATLVCMLVVWSFAASATAAMNDNETPSLLDVRVGQFVKVEGRLSPSGLFEADEVTLRDANGTAKIEGPVDAVSGDRGRIEMLGFTVLIDRTTQLYRGSQASTSRAMLVRGAWLEAKGLWRSGTLRATRIRVKGAPESTQEIEGVVEGTDAQAGLVTILNRRIALPERVPVIDERTGASAPASTDRLRRDDDDGQGLRPLVMGPVVLGGRLEAGFEDARRFDLDDADPERAVSSRVQLLASSAVTDTIEAYAKVSLSRTVDLGSGPFSDVQLSEAYLLVNRVAGTPVDLQIGRQRFRDAREWLFDEYLDGVRVRAGLAAWTFEGAVTHGLGSGPTATRRRRDQWQAIGSASVQTPFGARVTTTVVARNDETRRERPTWLAGLVDGRVGSQWSYWSHTTVRRGRTTSGTRLRGWAVDVGATHRWAVTWAPSVTLGYAFGAGDSSRSDGVDSRFRQTDLEDNRAYYGGLRRLSLYGELFDPELSNLRVVTAGVGIRPRRALSLDVIYHHDAQVVASTSLPSGELAGRLTGLTRQLGREVDVVLTFRPVPGLDVDLAGGVFLPGSAFAGAPRPAVFWRPQLRLYF